MRATRLPVPPFSIASMPATSFILLSGASTSIRAVPPFHTITRGPVFVSACAVTCAPTSHLSIARACLQDTVEQVAEEVAGLERTMIGQRHGSLHATTR